MRPLPNRWKPHLAMALQTLLIGPSYTFGKYATAEIDPIPLMTMRIWLAALTFGLIFLGMGGWGERKPTRQDWFLMLRLAFVGTTLNSFFYIVLLNWTTPGNTALIYGATPLSVLLMAVFVRRSERLTRKKLLAVLMAVVGVVIVVLAVAEGQVASHPYLGNLVGLMCLAFWTYYLTYSKKIMERFPAIKVTAMFMVMSALFFLPLGAYFLPDVAFAAISPRAWFGLGYMAAVNSLLSFLLVSFALRYAQSSQVAIYMNLQPAWAAVFSFMLGVDALSPPFIAGGLLTLAGVYILNTIQKKERAAG